jgi:ribose transport system permease protein
MSQAIVIIVGGMNVSIGGIGGLAAISIGFAIQVFGLNPLVAVVLSFIVGSAAGLLNGLLITKLKINAFVVTLATSFIFVGIVKGSTAGYPFSQIPPSFSYIAKTDVFGFIPLIFLIMLFFLIFFALFFKYSVFGRKLLATGGSLEAAKMSGINTDKMIISANVISGIIATFVGVFYVAKMRAASPLIGDDWMITSFAVAVIGGTTLSGGKITMVGLFASCILITIIKNGLIMMKANVYYLQTFLGLIIIAEVILEVIRARYNSRSMKLI